MPAGSAVARVMLMSNQPGWPATGVTVSVAFAGRSGPALIAVTAKVSVSTRSRIARLRTEPSLASVMGTPAPVLGTLLAWPGPRAKSGRRRRTAGAAPMPGFLEEPLLAKARFGAFVL